MASVIIVNPTSAEFTNVNAAGADVPAYSMGTNGVGTAATLTAAELDTLLGTTGAVVIAAATAQEARRLASKILRLGRNPGSSILGQ